MSATFPQVLIERAPVGAASLDAIAAMVRNFAPEEWPRERQFLEEIALVADGTSPSAA